MNASGSVESGAGRARVPWGDVVLCAVAAVSWALIGMAGTAALGLHLLQADAAGSLGPMTAAVVALGAGGSVTPSADVSAFGLTGAQAGTAIEITPLGVSLVGALLLAFFFLRSLRGAGVVIAPAELLARAGAVVALFVAMLGGLAWAGHDVITLDGSSLGLDDLPGGGGDGGLQVPGLGDISGLLPDRVGDLVDARATVGFTVDTAPTLLGGLGWSAGILLIALLASRRTPLPRGWQVLHRVVRPAVSAVVTVLLVAVAAGLAAAAYAAAGDDHPGRIAGAALLGAPNGVWTGVPIGLFVPWDGQATGEPARLLPDPLDDLLRVGSGRSVTLGRLAELDARVWLLGVAAALLMLLAGVLTAVRTPAPAVAPGGPGPGPESAVRGAGALRFAGRCALRLGAAGALALPLLAWLTEVSVGASLSVLGFDAFDAGVELHGRLGTALLLGAVWGAGAGAVGASAAWASGAAGRRAVTAGWGDVGAGAAAWGLGDVSAREGGPYTPGTPYRPPDPDTNPYLRVPQRPETAPPLREPGVAGTPRWPDAPPPPGEPRRPGDVSRPAGPRRPEEARSPGEVSGGGGDDVDMYGAPTVVRPIGPAPQGPRAGRRPRPRPEDGPPTRPGDGPPPPPPPPPPSPKPGGTG
ncbi:streptophobe family protein [Streptomyces sp. NPDC052682]|uniref:streptophobe family protein n=1 Tax=Streptomyces sp. NPDC052682 TaxID=3154954 RepID=UPI0034218C05